MSDRNELTRKLEGSSLETIRHMVATGAGITVLPSSSNTQPAKTSLLSMVPFEKPAPMRRVALAWRKSFTRPQAIEALRSIAAAESTHYRAKAAKRLLQALER